MAVLLVGLVWEIVPSDVACSAVDNDSRRDRAGFFGLCVLHDCLRYVCDSR